ncbi:MAG TPA: BrxA/BrxB family bacilliredoxin, partial [Bacteroidia bacterium]|nr:BrxA/BrxB family bacilliredoxin [Bacteroidia bacterium]
MPYPEMLVAPMRAELTNVGFTELKTPEDVEKVLNEKDGTALVVFNSV